MDRKRCALVSVYNKVGMVADVQRLVNLGWTIFGSRGTVKELSAVGLPAIDVAGLVGGGPILGHRVVTLSREVHAALLADALKPEDLAELMEKCIPFIDLVRCDFYPLREAITNAAGLERQAAIDLVVEKTDIGGPCMVRSGAKGLRVVVCRKQDMEAVLQELEATGDVSLATRQELRWRAEAEVGKYVCLSAEFQSDGKFRSIHGERFAQCKYGENAWQTPAEIFNGGGDHPLAIHNFQLIEGTGLSWNNYCDLDRLLQTLTHMCAGHFKNFNIVQAAGVGVKHGNACAAAQKRDALDTVYAVARGDRRAIFGGSVIFNFELNGSFAEALAKEAASTGQEKQLFDMVVAPSFTPQAVEELKRKSDKCRLVVNPALSNKAYMLDARPRFRYFFGGDFGVQSNYTYVLDLNDPELQSYGPSCPPGYKPGVILSWAVAATSNSNTITIVEDDGLWGNGVGQQDRVGACELAVKRGLDAGHKAGGIGLISCSDSFFPYPDAVQVLIDAGVKLIFAPSGGRNAELVQRLCVEKGVTLLQLPDAKCRGFFGH